MRDCSKCLVNNLKMTDKATKRQLFLTEIGPFTSVKTQMWAVKARAAINTHVMQMRSL